MIDKTELPEDFYTYKLTFEQVLDVIEWFNSETDYLAKNSGMPEHELWDIRRKTTRQLRNMLIQYVGEKVYR